MFRCNATRALTLGAALLLLPSACAGDGSPNPGPPSPSPSPSPGDPVAPPITGTSDASPAGSTSVVTAPDEAVRLIEVTYAGGQVASGSQRRTAQVGEKVRLRVESDVTDEIHVHTYDLRAPVGPGRPGVIEFEASIPGRHEVELEKKHQQLLVLEVR